MSKISEEQYNRINVLVEQAFDCLLEATVSENWVDDEAYKEIRDRIIKGSEEVKSIWARVQNMPYERERIE